MSRHKSKHGLSSLAVKGRRRSSAARTKPPGSDLAALRAADMAVKALRQSEQITAGILDAMPMHIALLDSTGKILRVNKAWEHFALQNGATTSFVGENYLEVCRKYANESDPKAAEVLAGLDCVLSGSLSEFACEYECSTPTEQRWFRMVAARIQTDRGGVVVYHLNITPHRLAEIAFQEHDVLLRQVFEGTTDIVSTVDLQGRYTMINTAGARLLKKPASEIVGKSPAELLPSAAARAIVRQNHQILSDGKTRTFELSMELPGGEIRLLTTKGVIRDFQGQILGIFGISRDITELYRAKGAERLLACIVESSNDAIFSLTPDLIVTSWNRGAELLYGFSAGEMLGQHIKAIIPPDRLKEIDAISRKLDGGEVVRHFETQRRTKHGPLLNVDLTISPMKNDAGELIGRAVIAHDITDLKKLEREILEIIDRERERIGQDLHDQVCQTLAGMSLLAGALRERLAKQSRSEAEDAERLSDLARQAGAETRAVAKGLTTLKLSGDNFMRSLEELASNVEGVFKIRCAFEAAEPVIIEDQSVARHLYRIAHEAACNAAKHSRANAIAIALGVTDLAITLTIQDDGVGFPAAPDSREGLGLEIMKYRAGLIGATLQVLSDESRGTKVVCVLPKPATE